MSLSTTQESLQVAVIGARLEVEICEWDEDTRTDVIVDISGATTLQIIVKRPDATVFTRTAILSSTGADGKMYIVTIAGDLTIEGTYYIQGYLVTATWDGPSTIGEFEVHENLT